MQPAMAWEVELEVLSVEEQVDLTEVMAATVWSTPALSTTRLPALNTGQSHTSMVKKLGMKEVVELLEFMADLTWEVLVEASSGLVLLAL